jgi:hypothetical protein
MIFCNFFLKNYINCNSNLDLDIYGGLDTINKKKQLFVCQNVSY